MANIRVDSPVAVYSGLTLTFKSPADCSQVTGLSVYYQQDDQEVKTEFQFADAHGNNVGDLDLFAASAVVKVVLDTAHSRAYVQNADTNAYLEGKFRPLEEHTKNKDNPHGMTASQIGAAPASFGLGRQVTMSTEQTLTNANDGVLTGWYRIEGSTTNGVGGIAIMRVEAYSANNVVQTAYLQNRSDYVTIKRRCCLSGTWKDWEDITPSSFVPTSRTINGKALSENISLSAGDVGARPNTWTPSASDVGAAPAGYGLGEKAGKLLTSAHDLNTVFAGGWYKWTANSIPANVPPNCTYGVMVVNPYSDGVVVQKVYYMGNGKQLTPTIIRQIWGNGIGEWEWENPFMLVGEEYRTTEYHNGNPVYKKMDSGGVVWWSTDKIDWYREAERHGAAPAGFGLGEAQAFYMANIDAIIKPGFYSSGDTVTVCGHQSNRWWMLVKAYGNGAYFVTQELHTFQSGVGYKFERHKINGTWGAWTETTPSVFAPAGYGLGPAKSLTSADDINTLKGNGWYHWHSSSKPANIPTLPGTYYMSHLRVWGNDGGCCCQEIMDMTDSGLRGAKVQRTIYGDTAYDWEWVNPPMVKDVEYRTTERINGKAVYKKNDGTNILYRLDGESTWYPEKMGMKLLWTNASHTSAFGAQSVSVALSGYQWVAIKYKLGHDKNYVKTVFGAVGDTLVMDMITSGDYIGQRKAITSTSKVEFEAATYSANVDNKQQYFIPIAIYGIKGVV